MRKILFRGRDHAGKWHKGSLISRIEESPVPETAVPYVVHYIKGQDFAGEEHEVDPETIGQLVSPAAELHPDIWEGDIIDDKDGYRMEVIFEPDENAFYAIVRSEESEGRGTLSENFLSYEFLYIKAKVVGNIHDNPELITRPFS